MRRSLRFLPRPRRSLLLLALAMLAVLPVYGAPTLIASGLSYAYLFVIDVSQSMNVADQGGAARPRARLLAAKQALSAGLRQLPCGSRAALGLFADDETLVLFEPLEVCAHYAAMENVVAGISWRAAWGGNSQIDAGLLSAIREAARRKLNLVFFSDGDQAPRREALRLDALRARRGAVKGLVVGVGGEQERPVPKLDAQDRIVGYWQAQDAVRNGFNPNLAGMLENLRPDDPLPAAIAEGAPEHRSALRSEALQQQARAAGLDYLRLRDSSGLARALQRPTLADVRPAPRDLRPLFGLAAALLLLAAWLLPERS